MQKLGGCVVPKLNWSCPIDSVWISINGIRCHSADDVLLLLKASDRVAHDLDLLASFRSSTAPKASPDTGTVGQLFFFSRTSVRSPRKIFIFITWKKKIGSKYPQNMSDYSENRSTTVGRSECNLASTCSVTQ